MVNAKLIAFTAAIEMSTSILALWESKSKVIFAVSSDTVQSVIAVYSITRAED